MEKYIMVPEYFLDTVSDTSNVKAMDIMIKALRNRKYEVPVEYCPDHTKWIY